MNIIGIMQGRLSSPTDGRIQSFPVHTWRVEFRRAHEAGLGCVEWVDDAGTESMNPLWKVEGRSEVKKTVLESGVRVSSVCADAFMERTLFTPEGHPHDPAVDRLKRLIAIVADIGATHIVLPFVDASSIRSAQRIPLVRLMREILPILRKHRVEVHLETDWRARDLVEMLGEIDSPFVKANYDIGNSASLGHPPGEDLPRLADWLGSVHVKDRKLNGGTVPLGSGSADFTTVFRILSEIRYTGPFILQVARDQDGDEVKWAIRNRKFVEGQLKECGTVKR